MSNLSRRQQNGLEELNRKNALKVTTSVVIALTFVVLATVIFLLNAVIPVLGMMAEKPTESLNENTFVVITAPSTTCTTVETTTTVASTTTTTTTTSTEVTTSEATSLSTTSTTIIEESTAREIVNEEATPIRQLPTRNLVTNTEVVQVDQYPTTTIAEENGTADTASTAVEETTEIEETETQEEATVAEITETVSVSDSDYILLCNAVAHEAGSLSIPVEDKAKVVEVIMNRVADNRYPDTIYGVLSQKNQFTGASSYVNLTTYSAESQKVEGQLELIQAGVNYYFDHPDEFQQGYLGFHGDGRRNYFQ